MSKQMEAMGLGGDRKSARVRDEEEDEEEWERAQIRNHKVPSPPSGMGAGGVPPAVSSDHPMAAMFGHHSGTEGGFPQVWSLILNFNSVLL